MPLAGVKDEYPGPRVGKYCFNQEAIEFGNDAIERGAKRDILIVDELGHLELAGQGFTRLDKCARRVGPGPTA